MSVPGQIILDVQNVSKSFNGVHAVNDASFQVSRGTITALIGPNGAGKTTMFDLLSGFARPDGGKIFLSGQNITDMATHRIVHHGLVRTFQLTRVLAGMSVMDNMLLAASDQPGEKLLSLLTNPSRARAAEAMERHRAIALLETFGLKNKETDFAGALSGGQRKLLEIARTLMTNPSIVLLDEPMAGVNPTLGRSILDHIEDLRNRLGTTFLFVEHDMDIVMSRSDHVIVLAQGTVIANGPPSEIQMNPKVVSAYLGGSINEVRE